MVEQTFLDLPIVSQFILPFLLIFLIVFALLEKTKLLGDKKQVHALIAFVIGLIFVGAVFPKLVVGNLILFLTVALIIIFVLLLLWGFIFSGEKGFQPEGWMKKILWAVIGVAVIVAVIWATGFYDEITNFFSGGGGLGQTIIANVAFVVVIAIVLALVLRSGKSK